MSIHVTAAAIRRVISDSRRLRRPLITLLSLTTILLAYMTSDAGGASVGATDPLFGRNNGRAVTSFREQFVEIWNPTEQIDGKIVAVDYASVSDFVIVRFHADGRADLSFGLDGAIMTDLGGNDRAVDVAPQVDGRVVVAGTSDDEFAVARYNANGTIDETFGNDGWTVTGFAGAGAEAKKLLLQGDGKIVVAGHTGGDFALARYDRDGQLDPSFGSGGKVTADYVGTSIAAHQVGLQDDGKIVVAGRGGHTLILARFDRFGTLDVDFGNQGWVARDLGDYFWVRKSMILKDGKITVAAGKLLIRYNENGSLDENFGSNGIVDDPRIYSIVTLGVQPGGKLVLLTNTQSGSLGLARYHSDGTRDVTFGDDGFIWNDPAGGDGSSVAAGLVLETGKILAAAEKCWWDHTGGSCGYERIWLYHSDGSLDSGFAMGQGARYYRDSGVERGHFTTVTNDGRIIAGGSGDGGSFALAAHRSDGSLDQSYGDNGLVLADFAEDPSQDFLHAAVAQEDGKIVVAGTSTFNANPGDLTLARVNSDGALDASFGVAGRVATDIGGFDEANAVTIQNDGKIIVAGSTSDHLGSFFVLARYHENGLLDATFGDDGYRKTQFLQENRAHAVGVQDDGKIVVAGVASDETGSYCALARYDADGSLDSTYGDGGRIISDFQGACTSLALQTDGKLIVAGAGDGDFALTRYDSAGNIDAEFGQNGLVSTKITDAADSIEDVTLQSDGKIVALGSAGGDPRFALVRYKYDGSLDSSFASNGIARFGTYWFTEHAHAVAIRPQDDKIVAIGEQSGYFYMARFDGSGNMDTGLGGDGSIIWGAYGEGQAKDLIVHDQGKVTVAGTFGSDIALVRFDDDGSVDETFGDLGLSTINMMNTDLNPADDGAYEAVEQDDGKLVVAGSYAGNFALIRYLPDGSQDPSFGSDGQVITDFYARDDGSYAVFLLDDGRIVAAGAGGDDMAVARYQADGSLDPTFGDGGRVVTDFYGRQDVANDASLLGSNATVVAGSSDGDFALARYLSDGSLDAGFGNNGRVITDFGNEDDTANAVAVLENGSIVAIGSTADDFALARYLADGSLDANFGVGGRVVTDFAGRVDIAKDVTVLEDGSYLVAGSSGDDFALAWYNDDGTLNPDFGNAGLFTIDFWGGVDSAAAIARWDEHRILAAGSSRWGSTDTSLTISRVEISNDARKVVSLPIITSGFVATKPVSWLPFNDPPGATSFEDVFNPASPGSCPETSCPLATTDGISGMALLFDGTDDHVSLGNPDRLNISGHITLEAWIKMGAVDGIQNIIAHGYSTDPKGEVFLRVNDGNYQAGSWDGQAHRVSYPVPAEDIGSWVHLVGTYDGKAWRLYRNGFQINVKQDAVGSVKVHGNWAVGARGDGTERFFGGQIDEVRIYDLSLTPAAVTQRYAQIMAQFDDK